jgi:hypothetical protein
MTNNSYILCAKLVVSINQSHPFWDGVNKVAKVIIREMTNKYHMIYTLKKLL